MYRLKGNGDRTSRGLNRVENPTTTRRSKWVVLSMLLELDDLDQTVRRKLKSLCQKELYNVLVDCVNCPVLLERIRGIVCFAIDSDEERSCTDYAQSTTSNMDTVLDTVISWSLSSLEAPTKVAKVIKEICPALAHKGGLADFSQKLRFASERCLLQLSSLPAGDLTEKEYQFRRREAVVCEAFLLAGGIGAVQLSQYLFARRLRQEGVLNVVAEPEIFGILRSCFYSSRTDLASKTTALTVACLAVLYYEQGYLDMKAELQHMVFDNRLPCHLRQLALHGGIGRILLHEKELCEQVCQTVAFLLLLTKACATPAPGTKYAPEVVETFDFFFEQYIAAGSVKQLADGAAMLVSDGLQDGLLRMVVHANEVLEDPVRPYETSCLRKCCHLLLASLDFNEEVIRVIASTVCTRLCGSFPCLQPGALVQWLHKLAS